MSKIMTSTLFYVLVYMIVLLFTQFIVSYTYLSISILELFLITIATFRGIRLVTYDSVTKPFRQYISTLSKKDGDVFYVLNQMIKCPWCSGLWVAPGMIIVYSIAPIFIIVFFIAGIATFVQLLSNCVGWKAEYTKNKVMRVKDTNRS